MSQMRSLARCARRWASRSGMRSPVYSAILRPRRKLRVAKQPLPLIGDLRIESPRASFRFIWQHCTTGQSASCQLAQLLEGSMKRNILTAEDAESSAVKPLQYKLKLYSNCIYI